jgi:hypothetical protein
VWVLNLSGEDKKKLQNNQKSLLLDQEAPPPPQIKTPCWERNEPKV